MMPDLDRPTAKAAVRTDGGVYDRDHRRGESYAFDEAIVVAGLACSPGHVSVYFGAARLSELQGDLHAKGGGLEYLGAASEAAVKKELDAAGIEPALDPMKIGATFYRRADL